MLTILKNFQLKEFNSLKFDKKANFFCRINSIEDCLEAIEFSNSNGAKPFILGSGTNLVLTQDVKGIVLKIELKGKRIEGNFVTLGAGENWHDSVLWTLKNGFYGLENLALIPGTVGAAPIQNIGAYGEEISSKINSVEVIDLENGHKEELLKEDCFFEYRHSFFKEVRSKYLITGVKLELSKEPNTNTTYKSLYNFLVRDDIDPNTATPNQVCRAVTFLRQQILPDPDKVPNVGSFFKNCILDKNRFEKIKEIFKDLPFFLINDGKYKIPSAYLIEKAGWKGYKEKEVSISSKHSLILITSGKAKSLEVMNLSSKIIEDIAHKYGIILEIEPYVF